VALVIGNDDYRVDAPLENSRRDAQLISASLTKLGFQLVGQTPQINLTRPQTIEMVKAFGILSKDADIALFYFYGFGFQVHGDNYLAPVDVTAKEIDIASVQSVAVGLLLRVLDESGARAKILLLDTDGLAPVEPSAGTIISLAAQPNGTAYAGPRGGISPYAKALSNFMQVKGLQFYAMLNEVGLAVMAETHNVQRPWVSSTPMQQGLYLNPQDDLMSSVPKVLDTGSPAQAKKRTSGNRRGR
jgi:uncharacterized caspase-like protein